MMKRTFHLLFALFVMGGNGFSSGSVQASTTPGEVIGPEAPEWAKTHEAFSAGMTANDGYVYENTAQGAGAPRRWWRGRCTPTTALHQRLPAPRRFRRRRLTSLRQSLCSGSACAGGG